MIYIYIYDIYIHIYIYIYIYIYNKDDDDEKSLIQNLKFHAINRQLNTFTKYDVTV